MKILSEQDFKKLPENTVFQKYSQSEGFGALTVLKQGEYGVDFVVENLLLFLNPPYEEIQDERGFIEGDTCKWSTDEETMLDGLFEHETLYAVWDNEDITNYIAKLSKCIKL